MVTVNKVKVLIIIALAIVGCKKQAKLEMAKMPFDNTVSVPTDTTLLYKLDSSSLKPTKDTATKFIVVMGSSTAAGWGASRWDSTWVGRLQNRLNKDSMKVNVINLGAPGYVTYQGMPSGFSTPPGRPQPDAYRNITRALTFHPVLMIFNFPTNDIANNYSNNEILDNYKQLIEIADSQKIEYIITGTQPRDFPSIEQRQRLKNLNDLMQPIYKGHYNNYLEKLSSPLFTVLNTYSAGDGTHLNDKGHKLIYESFISFNLLRKAVGY
jgi:acyl-CoA thioesterase-1